VEDDVPPLLKAFGMATEDRPLVEIFYGEDEDELSPPSHRESGRGAADAKDRKLPVVEEERQGAVEGVDEAEGQSPPRAMPRTPAVAAAQEEEFPAFYPAGYDPRGKT